MLQPAEFWGQSEPRESIKRRYQYFHILSWQQPTTNTTKQLFTLSVFDLAAETSPVSLALIPAPHLGCNRLLAGILSHNQGRK